MLFIPDVTWHVEYRKVSVYQFKLVVSDASLFDQFYLVKTTKILVAVLTIFLVVLTNLLVVNFTLPP
jgi:hypothetical protein